MAEYEREMFHPEEIDEQIDAYLAPPSIERPLQDRTAWEAVQALQRHFAPAEKDAALQRVWQRFAQHRTALAGRKVFPTRATARQEKSYRMEREHTHKESVRPLARRLELAGAVITVLLLLSSMAALFWLAPNGHTSVSGKPKGGQMMFAVSYGPATLYRLDLKTHQPLWHFSPPSAVGISFGQLVNDLYYITVNGKQGSDAFYVLDAASGTVRWSSSDVPTLSWRIVISSTALYFTQIKDAHLAIEALDLSNGKEKWTSYFGDALDPSSNPSQVLVVEPAIDVIAASDQLVYGEVITPKDGKETWQRFALNAQNGNPVWQKDEKTATMGSLEQGFLVDGVLCEARQAYPVLESNGQVTGTSYLVAYDATSGNQLWRKQFDGSRLSLHGTKAVNGVIYPYAMHPGPTGTTNNYYAFSVKDGTQLWQYQETNMHISSLPLMTEESEYFNRIDGQTLVALDAASGKVRWTYLFHDPITVEFPPAADNDQVYLSLPNNTIQVLRASDGKPLGSFQVPGSPDPNNRALLQVVG